MMSRRRVRSNTAFRTPSTASAGRAPAIAFLLRVFTTLTLNIGSVMRPAPCCERCCDDRRVQTLPDLPHGVPVDTRSLRRRARSAQQHVVAAAQRDVLRICSGRSARRRQSAGRSRRAHRRTPVLARVGAAARERSGGRDRRAVAELVARGRRQSGKRCSALPIRATACSTCATRPRCAGRVAVTAPEVEVHRSKRRRAAARRRFRGSARSYIRLPLWAAGFGRSAPSAPLVSRASLLLATSMRTNCRVRCVLPTQASAKTSRCPTAMCSGHRSVVVQATGCDGR